VTDGREFTPAADDPLAGAAPGALAMAPGRASAAARTPLMEQYARVKAEHPDAFLFFRLGDFYEMFFEDAIRASQLLGLTLTSRNRHDPEPIPMCGIPWHQRDGYVARLLRLGHKVAICDQLEDPASARGLVQRGVTEILTPGSITSDQFLEPGANNYLAAVWPAPEVAGVCLADASTGEVRLLELAWEEASDFLSRIRVAEWVTPAGPELEPALAERLERALRGVPGTRSPVPVARFGDASLPRGRWPAEIGGFEDMPAALIAAAGTLDYLDRMQGGRSHQLTRIERWRE
jgi:DNA mismatch repair protein MutS